MSIIQQLAQIEAKANEYANQRTVRIYTVQHKPRPHDPHFDIRVGWDTPERETTVAFLRFLAEHGIHAVLHRQSIDGNIYNQDLIKKEAA
jgi:hypothetical protein